MRIYYKRQVNISHAGFKYPECDELDWRFMAKTRICFVSRHSYGYFDPTHARTGGGAERQIHLLSTGLSDRFDVQVVVGNYGQQKEMHVGDVTLQRAYRSTPRKNAIQPIWRLVLLAQSLRRADADIYIHRGSPRNAAIVYALTALLNGKFVYHIANDANIDTRPEQLSSSMRTLFEKALTDADGIIAQTTHQQRRLQQKYGVESTVIPNGYPRSSDRAPPQDREYFLWVGSIDEDQKRPHLYLDIAEELSDQQFRLVGSIDDAKTYDQKLIQRSNDLDNVELVGEVPPDQIHDEFRNAIALVSTSAYEGFPNVFLEAWRQATPVLSLSVDTGRYLSSQTGYAHDDMGHLKKLVKQLATDIETRDEIGDEVLDQFERKYTMEKVTETYATLLRTIAGGR